jgi:hypothetical protein
MEKKQITEAPANPESISAYLVRAFNSYITPVKLDASQQRTITDLAKEIENTYYTTKKIDEKILAKMANAAYVYSAAYGGSDKKGDSAAKDSKEEVSYAQAMKIANSLTNDQKMNLLNVIQKQMISMASSLSSKDKQKLLTTLQTQLAAVQKAGTAATKTP